MDPFRAHPLLGCRLLIACVPPHVDVGVKFSSMLHINAFAISSPSGEPMATPSVERACMYACGMCDGMCE